MRADENSVNQFLKQPETQFVIPVYQRNYDWGIPQCKQLLDDIIKSGADDKINSHFIGSIVYIQDKMFTSNEIKELVIIDGQQRITTITLIYIALFHLANQIDKKLKERIEELYLINKFSDKKKLKLRPTANNDSALDYLLHKNQQGVFGEFSRVTENYEFIAGFINAENFGLIQKGLDKLMFVEIILERDKDNPQRIFESLNSTGLDLSQADLIRNYILMSLRRKKQIEIYENFWLPIENSCTETDTNTKKVSDFIRHFLTIETQDIPNKDKVYQAFKTKYPCNEGPEFEQTLANIKKYSTYFNRFINSGAEPDNDIRREIYYLGKLEITVSYPFLLEIYRDYENGIIDKSTIIEILRLIQSFAWRRFIIGLPSNSLNKIFLNLYKEIDKRDYLGSLKKALANKKGSQRFPKDGEVIAILKEKDIYNIQTRNRMYFLDLLENFNNNEPVLSDELSVEHIFPQKPDSKWFSDLGEEQYNLMKDKYLNTIANLTLTGYNSPLGNKPFTEKRDLPEKGYRASRLLLNQSLRDLTKWDVEELEKRFGFITERFLKIWKYPHVKDEEDNQSDEINIFDADDPKGKRLEYFIFFDQKLEKTRVSELYEHVLRALYDLNPETFFKSDLGEKLELTSQKENLRQALALSESYFIEANLDSRNKFIRLKYALNKFDLTDELFIKYATENSMDND